MEIITVIAIIALLAALMEPALLSSRRAAKRSVCQSNLRQIGAAFKLYGTDWDDYYPWAVDAFVRTNREAWQDYPAPIESIPDMVSVLSRYASGERAVFRCPADTQTFGTPPVTHVNAFAFAGTSYIFRTIRYFGKPQSGPNEVELRLCEDAGPWHCHYRDPNLTTKTTNALFGDGHVRFVSVMDRS